MFTDNIRAKLIQNKRPKVIVPMGHELYNFRHTAAGWYLFAHTCISDWNRFGCIYRAAEKRYCDYFKSHIGLTNADIEREAVYIVSEYVNLPGEIWATHAPDTEQEEPARLTQKGVKAHG